MGLIAKDPSGRGDVVATADEVTPLLGAPTTGGTANRHVFPPHANGKATDVNHEVTLVEEKPMPVVQILILCYTSVAEPIGYFAIVPFISEMIQRNGHLHESEIGNWAGIIEGLFSVVQMCLMIFYGRMSDRLGRKPVLVFSMIGMSLGMTLFGFSRNIWQMIVFRAMAGCFAGSTVTVRTMISENTTKLNQGRAFSWYMFARNLGILLGPLLGGALSNPSEQYPGVFGSNPFFEEYPYALSTIVTGAITMSGALLCLFVLKETLVRKSAGDISDPPMSAWEVFRAPGVGIILYIMAHIMFLSLAYTAVMPIVMYTRIDLGGFNFTPSQISYMLAIAGTSQALWILVVFPPLQRSIGTGNVMRICSIVWPVFMAMYPVVNEAFRHEMPKLAMGLLIPTLVLGSGVAMGFGMLNRGLHSYGTLLTEPAALQLCINDISPSPAVLGTVNALGLSITSGVRAVAPPLFTPLYAKGVSLGWADGHLVWFFFVALSMASNIPLCFLPAAAEGKVAKQTSKNAPEDDEADDGAIR